jgi:hypothetical protein
MIDSTARCGSRVARTASTTSGIASGPTTHGVKAPQPRSILLVLEGIIEWVRTDPEFTVRLIRDVLHVPVPEYELARSIDVGRGRSDV